MTDAFFIGIGGTGAKCAEALIHLCAAGLGPEHCWIALVDQDQSNGNIGRTKQILEQYVRARSDFKRVGENSLSSDAPLLRTEILTPAGSAVWCPVPTHGTTLGDIFNYNLLRPELRDLLDSLYLPEERDLPLDEGFRARPSLGAATVLSRSIEDDPLWESVFAAIDQARQGRKVRIFLTASIFGGTGAAGFPTLARVIRRTLEKRRISQGVHIGGALMLPYFSFPPPPTGGSQVLADSSAFLEQAQGALAYYYRLFKREHVFDSLYLTGWQPLIELEGFEKGGPQQKNPPLIPELYGALAAQRFFGADDPAPAALQYMGRQENGQVGWDDLPAIGQKRGDVRANLGRTVRFAHAYHSVYRPALAMKGWRAIRREPWFQRLIGRHGATLSAAATQDALNSLDTYCQELLRWVAGVSFVGSGKQEPVTLFDAPQFAHYDENNLAEPVELRSPRSMNVRAFDKLVVGENGPSLASIFDQLTYEPPALGNHGLGTFLASLHAACASLEGRKLDVAA